MTMNLFRQYNFFFFTNLFLSIVPLSAENPARDLEIRLLEMVQDAKPGESWVVAPQALSELLFLLYEGSNGGTTELLQEHLFEGIPRDELHPHVNALKRNRFGYRSIAGVWVDPVMDLLPSFQESVEEHWRAPLMQAPLATDPIKAMLKINEWFSRQTNGRFPNVLTEPPLQARHLYPNGIRFVSQGHRPGPVGASSNAILKG